MGLITLISNLRLFIICKMITADNITSDIVLSKRQIANCCASKKVIHYVENLESGKKCSNLLANAELIFAIVDMLKGYVPVGEVIRGTQAYSTLNVVTANTVNITIGSAVYPQLNIAGLSVDDVAKAITDYINSFYPHSYSYTASQNGSQVIISGSNYDEDNSTNIRFYFFTPPDIDVDIYGTLTGGTEKILQGDNCLRNEDVITILNKLQTLC